MRECKEAIKAAIIIRQKYVHMNRAVLAKSEFEKVEQGLTEYDTSVKKMLQVVFYVQMTFHFYLS